MKKLADRTFWWIELFAGLGFMTVGFFQDCSLTFGTAIISLALWPTLFLSAAVCVYRLLHFKTYSKSRGFWLIAALCVTYLLSTFLQTLYGLADLFSLAPDLEIRAADLRGGVPEPQNK